MVCKTFKEQPRKYSSLIGREKKELTSMYADTALNTADEPAGPVLCYMRVRQLSLPTIIRLAGLGVETHFWDERFGPLAPPWTIHECCAATSSSGLRLEGKRELEARSFFL